MAASAAACPQCACFCGELPGCLDVRVCDQHKLSGGNFDGQAGAQRSSTSGSQYFVLAAVNKDGRRRHTSYHCCRDLHCAVDYVHGDESSTSLFFIWTSL